MVGFRLFTVLALSAAVAPFTAAAQLLAQQDRPLSAVERARLTSIESQLGRISAQRNTSVAALRTIALAMGTRFTALAPDQLLRAIDARAVELNAARTRITELQGQLDAIDSMKLAKAVGPLLAQATAAIDAGRLIDADTLLAQAVAQFAGARTNLQARVDQIGVQEAAVLAQQAGVRSALSDFAGAAGLYDKAGALATASAPRNAWRYRIDQYNALYNSGLQGGSGIADGVAMLQAKALPLVPRAAQPDDWATTQFTIGSGQFHLFKRKNDVALLRASIASVQLAVDATTPATDPRNARNRRLQLASSQSELALVADDLSASDKALAAMQALEAEGNDDLTFLTYYALVEDNRATLLARQGREADSVAAVRQTIALLEKTLTKVDRTKQKPAWLQTQTNIGLTQVGLAKRTRDAAVATTALASARVALAETNKGDAPVSWALAKQVEGDALIAQNRFGTPDRASITAALAALNDAASVLTRADWPLYWAGLQFSIGQGRRMLARLDPTPASFAAAADAYAAVGQVVSRKDQPSMWATIRVEQAGLLADRAEAKIDARAAVAEADAVLAEAAPVIAAGKLATLDADATEIRARIRKLR